ncbi:MAG TPA: hypothetical protein VFZ25_12985 [Chloroflexota bacterium]|nr:hypothetical protein [Chloroflexota bacterium]
MLQGIPIPGRTKPTAREVYRAQIGPKVQWQILPHGQARSHPATVICPRCHAISNGKRWFLNEELYQCVRNVPEVRLVVCPGCQRLAANEYEGVVELCSPLLRDNRAQALHLIANVEDQARRHNPNNRVLAVEGGGDSLEVYTTTNVLAEQIGRAFQRSFKGTLQFNRAPGEKLSRVYWIRC